MTEQQKAGHYEAGTQKNIEDSTYTQANSEIKTKRQKTRTDTHKKPQSRYSYEKWYVVRMPYDKKIKVFRLSITIRSLQAIIFNRGVKQVDVEFHTYDVPSTKGIRTIIKALLQIPYLKESLEDLDYQKFNPLRITHMHKGNERKNRQLR